ncbi:MAG: hypothetical protein JOZ12_13360 [Sinobacteraceae bacterium]|nr:hypothetical protein [Nevskiaceae bacterium]
MSLRARPAREWLAAVCGLLLLAALLLPLGSAQQRLLSYLFAFVFFTGLSVGSLALLMAHILTGGAWGEELRPFLLAAARTVPLQALLAVPILVGLPVLYPWARADAGLHDALLRAQSWYLAPTFFVVRTIAYFALWTLFLWLIGRHRSQPSAERSLAAAAASGLIVFALSSLLAATDWLMSLLPHWHSSTFGMLVATGWMLAAAALAILYAAGRKPIAAQSPQLLADLGNLLLVFVLAWAYLAYMQYLTIWIADLPAETSWYIPRTLTSWRAVAAFLIAFQFAVPFAMLLSRRTKRRASWLAGIAALLLIAHVADAFWLTAPTLRPSGFDARGSDLLALLGMGALWWALYSGQLHAMPSTLPGERDSIATLENAHG